MKQQKVAKFSTYVFRLQKNKELSWEHQALLKQILRDKFLVKGLKKRPEASLRFSSEANSGGKREAMLADFKNRSWDWRSQFWPGSHGINSWRGKKGQINRRVHGTPVYTYQKVPRKNHGPWSLNNASLFCLRWRRSGQREKKSDHQGYCPVPGQYEAIQRKCQKGKGICQHCVFWPARTRLWKRWDSLR